MSDDKTLEKLTELEEKSRKLPPLSAKDAENFDTANMVSSVFYSNLLEGNILSKKEAIKAIFGEKGRRNVK